MRRTQCHCLSGCLVSLILGGINSNKEEDNSENVKKAFWQTPTFLVKLLAVFITVTTTTWKSVLIPRFYERPGDEAMAMDCIACGVIFWNKNILNNTEYTFNSGRV